MDTAQAVVHPPEASIRLAPDLPRPRGTLEGAGRGRPGPAWPDLATNRTARKYVACHDPGHTTDGNGTCA